MDYMILDSRGDAVATFDDETAARATLRAIAQSEPDVASDLVMIAYDDDGMPVGEAVTAADLPLPYSLDAATSVSVWASYMTTAAYRLERADAELDRWLILRTPRLFQRESERQPA